MTFPTDVTDSHGMKWMVIEPCVFCGNTFAIPASQGSWTETSCPANGNGRHIRVGDYPADILLRILTSRGLAAESWMFE